MQSKAKTVKEYLSELPDDRKKIITDLRKAVMNNIPKGFEETMNYGMIGYVVPHKLYKDGYHCDPTLPVPFMNIASQKNHIAVYHMALYDGALLDWFKDEWKVYSSKKLDMGKCCIRFKKPEDVPVELIGVLASKLTPQQWIDIYEKGIKKK
jgi:hypothetical protein